MIVPKGHRFYSLFTIRYSRKNVAVLNTPQRFYTLYRRHFPHFRGLVGVGVDLFRRTVGGNHLLEGSSHRLVVTGGSGLLQYGQPPLQLFLGQRRILLHENQAVV